MNPTEVRAALTRARQVGPFFTVHEHAAGQAWRRLDAVLDDDAWLVERVESVRASQQGRTAQPVEQRAVASMDHLGLIAHLISPCLAAAAMSGLVPVIEGGSVLCEPGSRGSLRFALDAVPGSATSSVLQAADALVRCVLTTVVSDVVHAYARAFRLSRLVLWGNVASALAGAAGEITRSEVPLVLEPGDIVRALLAREPLIDLGRYDGQRFARRTCCLFYRLPTGGTCGDCVLRG